MTFLNPSSRYALGDMDYRLYVGTPDPFAELSKDPDAELQYLVELYPFSETSQRHLNIINLFPSALPLGDHVLNYSGGEIKERLSDKGFTSKLTDSDPDRNWLGRVNNPLQFDTSIFSGGTFGNSSQSYGGIEIINPDGELDRFFDYHWSGRNVQVKVGGMDFSYDSFSTVLNGTVSAIEGDDTRILLTLRDNRARTDKPIVAPVYPGTGGLDGDPALEGVSKPLAYGVARNIPPTLINYANQIYQVHDGSVLSVDAVYDKGIALISSGDVPNIMTATVAEGHYVTQLSGGYIRLGSTPAGQITANVHGDNAGGFAAALTDIILRILKNRLGIYNLTSNDIDEGSFARVKMIVPGAAGLFISGDATGSSIMDALLNPLSAYWSFTRSGLLFAGMAQEPGMAQEDISHIDISGLRLQDIIPPTWKITVGYAPSVTVQSENDLAGGVTSDVQAFVTEAFRYVSYENQTTRLKNAQATELTFETALSEKADAQALLNKLAAVYGQKRTVFQVPVYKSIYRYFLGDVLTLKYNRYGLDSGKVFMVAGVSDNAQTGQTVLTLWG